MKEKGGASSSGLYTRCLQVYCVFHFLVKIYTHTHVISMYIRKNNKYIGVCVPRDVHKAKLSFAISETSGAVNRRSLYPGKTPPVIYVTRLCTYVYFLKNYIHWCIYIYIYTNLHIYTSINQNIATLSLSIEGAVK